MATALESRRVQSAAIGFVSAACGFSPTTRGCPWRAVGRWVSRFESGETDVKVKVCQRGASQPGRCEIGSVGIDKRKLFRKSTTSDAPKMAVKAMRLWGKVTFKRRQGILLRWRARPLWNAGEGSLVAMGLRRNTPSGSARRFASKVGSHPVKGKREKINICSVRNG